MTEPPTTPAAEPIHPPDATGAGGMPNVFSCDVEDWHQAFFHTDTVTERCYINTLRCLEVLEAHGVKGTFYVQGLVAEQRPEVVRAIADAGHEVQTHGYAHRLTWDLGPAGFRADLERSIKVIEDVSGTKVTGFRAPCFSIGRSEWWAFDIMGELGLTHDSSIFPMKTRRYGLRYEPGYSRVRGVEPGAAELEELPVTVLGEGRLRLPVGGGGYLRLMPARLLVGAMRRVNRAGRPFVLYCHPYEFAPEEFRTMPGSISLARRMHQQLFRSAVPGRMSALFRAGRFTTMNEALAHERRRYEESRA